MKKAECPNKSIFLRSPDIAEVATFLPKMKKRKTFGEKVTRSIKVEEILISRTNYIAIFTICRNQDKTY